MNNLLKSEGQQEDLYEFQVRRLRHLKGYPKGEDDELIRVARDFAPCTFCGKNAASHVPTADCRNFRTEQLCDAISQLVEECTSAPQPSELKQALIARRREPEPEWRKQPQQRTDASAWDQFCAENEQIMQRARQNEIVNREKNKRVREFLGIRDFMDVDFPQRWWAEQQLGYALSRTQREVAEHWFASLGPNERPNVVRKGATAPPPSEGIDA